MPNDLHDSRWGLGETNIYAKLLRELARVRAARGDVVELETWRRDTDGMPSAKGLAFGSLVRASYWLGDSAAKVRAFAGRYGLGQEPALVKVSRAEYEDVLQTAIELTADALRQRVPEVEPPWGSGCGRIPRDQEHFRALVERLRDSWGITPPDLFEGVVWTERKRKAKPKRRQKPRKTTPIKPLTDRQTEAIHLYGECQGNYAQMGKRMSISPKTVKQHYVAGMKKLSQTAQEKTHTRGVKKQNLPHDARGQVDLAEHKGTIVEGRKLDGKRFRRRKSDG